MLGLGACWETYLNNALPVRDARLREDFEHALLTLRELNKNAAKARENKQEMLLIQMNATMSR